MFSSPCLTFCTVGNTAYFLFYGGRVGRSNSLSFYSIRPNQNDIKRFSLDSTIRGREVCYYVIFSLLLQDGETPLHIAASRGHLECVQCLLEAKADLDVPTALNAGGNTPLHLSIGKRPIFRGPISPILIF